MNINLRAYTFVYSRLAIFNIIKWLKYMNNYNYHHYNDDLIKI